MQTMIARGTGSVFSSVRNPTSGAAFKTQRVKAEFDGTQ